MSGLFSIKNIDFETLSSSGNPRSWERPHCAPKFLREHVSAGQAWLFIVSPHLHFQGAGLSTESPALLLVIECVYGL